MPHVFSPKEGSKYSSQTESKREIKEKALEKSTIVNAKRHSKLHWIHASLGYKKKVVTRQITTNQDVDLTIQIYTKRNENLLSNKYFGDKIEIYSYDNIPSERIPFIASMRGISQAKDYDIIGYMEDDIFIEDYEFFHKLNYLHSVLPAEYAVMPHRCEYIENKEYVILSGDPDGGRNDLFWATNEKVSINWPTGNKYLYRAINPHSGCYFLSNQQAKKVREYWEQRNWKSNFQLSGPLEQAASGILLPVLKIMKPIPEDFKFLMVIHEDELWKRHEFETSS